MDTKGGRYTMQGNGQTFTGRTSGTPKVTPSRVSIENFANGDGTGSSSVKPELAEIECNFDRGQGFRWDETMLLQKWNFTLVETDVGVTHLFTGASFAGRGTIEIANGEVTGLKLQTDQYQQIQS